MEAIPPYCPRLKLDSALVRGCGSGPWSYHKLGQASWKSSVRVFVGVAEKLVGVFRELAGKPLIRVPAGILQKVMERCPLGC